MSSEEYLTSQISSVVSICTSASLWPPTPHTTDEYDLTGTNGIAFYWWGTGEDPEIRVDFVLESPTGFWMSSFYDGPAQWRHVFLPWGSFTWVSLPEPDLDPHHHGFDEPDKSQIIGFYWTVHTHGTRRIDSIYAYVGGNLPAEFIARHDNFTELFGEFESGQGAVDLIGYFEVGQGFNDLPAEFEIMVDRFTLIEEQIVTGTAVGRVTFTGLDLNAHKTYRLVAEWENPIYYQHYIALYYNGDEVNGNYESQYIRSEGMGRSSEKKNRPDIAWSSPGSAPEDRASSMADIIIGISPAGNITALSISKTTGATGIGLLNHAQIHEIVQANLTELVLSTRHGSTYAEVLGFEVGSKFRLYGYVA